MHKLLSAETPAELQAAYDTARLSAPTIAFRELLYGSFDRRSTPPTFQRRIELICDTLQQDQRDRSTNVSLYAHVADRLRASVIGKTRNKELSADITARYAFLDPNDPDRPLLALAYCCGDTPSARQFWHDEAQELRPDGGFERLLSNLASDLTADELTGFLQKFVKGERNVFGLVKQLRERLVAGICDSYAQTNGWDRSTTMFMARLDGSDRGMVGDVVNLVHPAALEKVRKRLEVADSHAARRRPKELSEERAAPHP
jgi:hypothetical protein